MAAKKYYFRCDSNPEGPVLVLDTYWEKAEMRGHPDYTEIDEFGETVVDEADEAERQIPLITAEQALAKR